MVFGGFVFVRYVIYIWCCSWNGGQGKEVGI